MSFKIKPLDKTDKEWVANLLKEWWAGPEVVSHGKVHNLEEYPGFIAVKGKKRVGLVTYLIDGKECEITSMNSLLERKGIGTALLDAVRKAAIENKCKRLWLITTNDNTDALRFYQKYGFSLIALYPNAMEKYRRLKPEIPLTGNGGIPIRDEIELGMVL